MTKHNQYWDTFPGERITNSITMLMKTPGAPSMTWYNAYLGGRSIDQRVCGCTVRVCTWLCVYVCTCDVYVRTCEYEPPCARVCRLVYYICCLKGEPLMWSPPNTMDTRYWTGASAASSLYSQEYDPSPLSFVTTGTSTVTSSPPCSSRVAIL